MAQMKKHNFYVLKQQEQLRASRGKSAGAICCQGNFFIANA